MVYVGSDYQIALVVASWLSPQPLHRYASPDFNCQMLCINIYHTSKRDIRDMLRYKTNYDNGIYRICYVTKLIIMLCVGNYCNKKCKICL